MSTWFSDMAFSLRGSVGAILPFDDMPVQSGRREMASHPSVRTLEYLPPSPTAKIRAMRIQSLFVILLAASSSLTASAAGPSDLSVDQQIEMARSLNEADRQATMAANVELSAQTAEQFWPVYRDYRTEVGRLNDELKRIILRYADSYGNLEPDTAYSLSEDVLSVQIKRDRLKQKYLKRFSRAASPLIAARAMQIENKLDSLAQVELAAAIPLVPAG
jgi:hypothetical protein